jgi:DNA-binding transcriptional MerR regulator
VHVVSTRTDHSYTIREAAELTGLPASTLRYYESIGVIAPVGRGETSKHRVYTEADLDQLVWVACLNATGMSVSDMKRYVANGMLGAAGAAEQVKLLTAQRDHLAREAERLMVRQRYVQLKIDYWQAIAAGDDARAELIAGEARDLADHLKPTKTA